MDVVKVGQKFLAGTEDEMVVAEVKGDEVVLSWKQNLVVTIPVALVKYLH